MLSGKVDVSYRGCDSGMGPGAGFPTNNSECGGSGAAHGSNGGVPLSLNQSYPSCNSKISHQYGFDKNETIYKKVAFTGSGGGSLDGTDNGGFGGGIISLEANNLTIFGAV